MISGTPIEQREIYLVPFPFSDLSAVKQRPILVLSNAAFHTAQQDVVVCQITSNISDDRYSVPLEQADLETGILKVASKIKPYRIAAVAQRLIGKRIGRVTGKKFAEALNALQKVIS